MSYTEMEHSDRCRKSAAVVQDSQMGRCQLGLGARNSDSDCVDTTDNCNPYNRC